MLMPLRNDALEIWRAGVRSVDSTAAVQRHCQCTSTCLTIAGEQFQSSEIDRIVVVGAGKAGAGMAHGIELVVSGTPWEKKLSGWINVPEDCARPLRHLQLFGARPPGRNEPTEAVLRGTNEILLRVQSLTTRDLCIVLLSGGASALLCRPVSGITLDDKLAVTRLLANSGAPIQDLNLVRSQISLVKGGRLAEARRAGRMIALVISDVIGDPLEFIGSGPTYPSQSRPIDALKGLQERGLLEQVPASVRNYLEEAALVAQSETGKQPPVTHCIVASNRIAIESARQAAVEMGYEVVRVLTDVVGDAAQQGAYFAELVARLRATARGAAEKRKLCLLGGGETTVRLNSDATLNGRGGRNQEFVLAAIAAHPNPEFWDGIAILSGGTDGEDGPTDAAGAVADFSIVQQTANMNVADALRRHDAWTLLNSVQGLIKTGPTHTNVMDLFVGLVEC